MSTDGLYKVTADIDNMWRKELRGSVLVEWVGPDSRAYHVKSALTDNSCDITSGHSGSVVRTIAEFRGVALVYAKRYEVSVIKGPLFGWEEVEPAILEFLQAFSDSTQQQDKS